MIDNRYPKNVIVPLAPIVRLRDEVYHGCLYKRYAGYSQAMQAIARLSRLYQFYGMALARLWEDYSKAMTRL